MAGPKRVLEPCITALSTRAGLVALGFMGRKFLLFPFARIVINQGHTSRSLYFLADHRAAVDSIHQFVAGVHPLDADTRTRVRSQYCSFKLKNQNKITTLRSKLWANFSLNEQY
jgi:hypothetical protein